MDIPIKTFIVTQVTGYVFLGLLTYWVTLQSTCDYKFCIKQNEVPVTDKLWESSSERLPFPEVHSPAYLMELTKHEVVVHSALSDLATNHPKLFQPALIAKVGRYFHTYEKDQEFVRAGASSSSIEDQALAVSQNPVLTLNMIWRFSNELTEIVELLENQPYNSRVAEGEGKDFIDNLQDIIAKWPNKWTMEEAMSAFLRIQMVYDLDVSELSSGRILGIQAGPHMDVYLMFALGSYAREKKMYTLAVPWLELAWDTLSLQNDRPLRIVDSKVTIEDAELQLLGAIKDHDLEHPSELQPWDIYFHWDKLLHKNGSLVEMRYPVRGLDWTPYRRMNSTYDQLNYWSLCTGQNHQTEEEKAELNCWYDRTSNPALSIFPIKKELLSRDPYIVQMHDVIGKSAFRHNFEPFKAKMEKSRVAPFKSSANKAAFQTVNEYRTSVNIVLNDPLPKLSKLIEWVTGLDVLSNSDSSEAYSLTSYAFGGHFDCHTDAYSEETMENSSWGNRIATVMFYLEEPEVGGLTAFPQAGIAVKPIKGSAIFWYNLKRSGKVDYNTGHCACPVVQNHKTISTKWIRFNSQFRLRPCGLNEED